MASIQPALGQYPYDYQTNIFNGATNCQPGDYVVDWNTFPDLLLIRNRGQ